MGWTFCMLGQIHTSNKTLRTVLEFVMLSTRLLNMWIMTQEFHIMYLFFFVWPEWWVAFQTSGSVCAEFRIVSLRIDYSDPEFPCWLFVIISPMFKSELNLYVGACWENISTLAIKICVYKISSEICYTFWTYYYKSLWSTYILYLIHSIGVV